MSRVAVGLLHYPVLDREGSVITTAITNLDLHDISRTARTYGVTDVFVVHPVAAQRELALRVRAHWVGGSGARRIPTREEALALIRVVDSLDDVFVALGGRDSIDVYVTSAASGGRAASSFERARARMESSSRASLLLFGTGWGLAPSVLERADLFLAPIVGVTPSGYNHLSVRAACAIIVDRLLGPSRD